jgi:hypothetical protein
VAALTYLRVVTIRSQALPAALVAALALVPAAASAPAATTPSPTHLQPRDKATAKRIRAEREAADILNAAMTTVRAKVAGCATRPGFDDRHSVTHDAPSPDFVNAIAALRRPATPAEQAAASGIEALLPGELYVDYRRDVTTAGGHPLTIELGRRKAVNVVFGARCLDAEHAEILKHLKGKPGGVRARTLSFFATFRKGQEAGARNPGAEVDGVYLFQDGSGGGGADFASFKKHGAFGSIGGSDHATVNGLVPDGVATVELIYAKVVPRGPDYKPTVYPTAVTLTLPVQENVVSTTVPRSAPDALSYRMVWLDAAGNVVNDVTRP